MEEPYNSFEQNHGTTAPRRNSAHDNLIILDATTHQLEVFCPFSEPKNSLFPSDPFSRYAPELLGIESDTAFACGEFSNSPVETWHSEKFGNDTIQTTSSSCSAASTPLPILYPHGLECNITAQDCLFLDQASSSTTTNVIDTKDNNTSQRCWEHGCNGRRFSTRGNFVRHQREKANPRHDVFCFDCGAYFSRTTARDKHILNQICGKTRTYPNAKLRPLLARHPAANQAWKPENRKEKEEFKER